MGISIAGSFKLGSSVPIDDRFVVDLDSQLNSISNAYEGLLAYSKETKKVFIYKGNNIWEDVNSNEGGGGINVNTSTLVYTTGSQTIDGIKTFNERLVVPEIRGTGLGGINRKIDLQSGQLYASSSLVSLDYFRRILSGNWQFQFRPTVSGVGVLLQGEVDGGSVTLPNDILFATGSQTITSPKNFTVRPTFNNLNLITTGDLVNLELNILGLEDFVRITGNQNISGIKNFNSRPTVMGTGVLLQGEIVQSMASPFNGNRTVKRSSWPFNTLLAGDTISGFLENVFFPYLNSSVTLSGPIRSYGIDSASIVNFAGNIITGDDRITGIAFRSGISLLNGPNPRLTDGSYSTNIVVSTSVDVSTSEIFNTAIYGEKNDGSNQNGLIAFSSPAQRIRFEPRYYFGSSNNTSLSSTDILTQLTPSTPSSYNYAFGGRPSSVTHSFTPNGQYIYFIYPSPFPTVPQDGIANWGDSLSNIYDVNANLDLTSLYEQLNTVTITFTQRNKTLRYRVYRSKDLLTVGPNQNFSIRFTFA